MDIENLFQSSSSGSRRQDDDEEALRWAAIEKLPTYNRLRTSILASVVENDSLNAPNNNVVQKEVDVRKLSANDRQKFIDSTFKVVEEDNERFLKKLRQLIHRYANY